jgi:hypothetical protein
MAGTVAVTESEATTVDAAASWPTGEILRDISRGGLAGLIVGVVVGGFGGRLFMRVAALLHPETTGMATANGNLIGDITLSGSIALIVFVGLFVGLASGVVWVTVQTWIPGSGLRKAILTMPVAVAIGARGLLAVPNPDFRILGYDPVIVALIIAFSASLGLSIALVDGWLDGRLPHATTGLSSTANAYAVLTAIGVTLGSVVVIPAFLFSEQRWVGVALVVTGVATLAWWRERSRGRDHPSRWVRTAGRGGVIAVVAFGFVMVAMDGAGALGLR